uniref:Family with sequence similarity 174 member B n=2 Tax=Echeneis naucrates TaxID=173247 RepID=A0A665UW40_ECHNA
MPVAAFRFASSNTMRYNLALTFIIAALWRVGGEPQTISSPAMQLNSTSSSLSAIGEDEPDRNVTDAAVGSRISSIMTYLPTLKNIVIFICVLTAALITGLVIKVIRSGRRIRKTRKYDIITTPAERVEMAPLNEENDDEDDSTLFDVKYRLVLFKSPKQNASLQQIFISFHMTKEKVCFYCSSSAHIGQTRGEDSPYSQWTNCNSGGSDHCAVKSL